MSICTYICTYYKVYGYIFGIVYNMEHVIVASQSNVDVLPHTTNNIYINSFYIQTCVFVFLHMVT